MPFIQVCWKITKMQIFFLKEKQRKSLTLARLEPTILQVRFGRIDHQTYLVHASSIESHD